MGAAPSVLGCDAFVGTSNDSAAPFCYCCWCFSTVFLLLWPCWLAASNLHLQLPLLPLLLLLLLCCAAATAATAAAAAVAAVGAGAAFLLSCCCSAGLLLLLLDACSCSEACTSISTRYCTYHEICTLRSTKYCACHGMGTPRPTKALHLLRNVHFKVQKVLSLPQNLSSQQSRAVS